MTRARRRRNGARAPLPVSLFAFHLYHSYQPARMLSRQVPTARRALNTTTASARSLSSVASRPTATVSSPVARSAKWSAGVRAQSSLLRSTAFTAIRMSSHAASGESTVSQQHEIRSRVDVVHVLSVAGPNQLPASSDHRIRRRRTRLLRAENQPLARRM